MTQTAPPDFAVGTLVRARGREWVVQPGSSPDFLLLQPLGGSAEDVAGVFPDEGVEPATFPPPSTADLGDTASTDLLRSALRVGFAGSAGPFRSLGGISVTPRSYQLVPLLIALRQEVVRVLIADDVGIGKTIEAGLIASELLAQGTVTRLAVLCSPSLAEQWQHELRDKFGIDAALVLTSTVRTLERDLMMNESLFDRHPFVIVSTDFIKSERRRYEFVLRCPELVIVDEAHNCVAGSGVGQGSKHQRYELLRSLAEDPQRHLVLATATPHSGDDSAFTKLIALCNPALEHADLTTPAGRELLARHFVQRRRADIRSYLDEDTPFPKDRETRDIGYQLSAPYKELFDDVLDYARERVRDGSGGARGRIRWWSALALLRALASSPKAAAATLRTRAEVAEARDAAEVDAIGRAGVLDSGDDASLEGIDTTPGSVMEPDDESADATPSTRIERRRLLAFAARADALTGVDQDRKLAAVTQQVTGVLKAGFQPIVFCRFIHTAEYVAEHLTQALGTTKKPVHVAAVTGELPPAERARRVAELTDRGDQRVLVATDCLSEGVNLQEAFSAVLHYDLAWNPTRHEQREGRVDRFGQRKDIVRALTLYGEDNAIDGIVLDVLIRKHRAIARATGVAVPVPGDGQAVIDALAEGLLLRSHDQQSLPLDLGLDERAQQLELDWQSAAEKEKVSRTRYAQNTIKASDVAEEVADIRRSLGSPHDLETFVVRTLRALGSTLTPTDEGYRAVLATLPLGARGSLPVTLREPLELRREPPASRGGAALARTDPAVQALGRYVLESALDPTVRDRDRPARRAGVTRTRDISTRTTVLLVRLRFQLDIPFGTGVKQLVAEDARVLAFEGSADNADWLPDARAEELLAPTPSGNVLPGVAQEALLRTIDGLPALADQLEAVADQHAERLLASHRRVRRGSGAALQGMRVVAQHPVDVLGVQVLLPAVSS